MKPWHEKASQEAEAKKREYVNLQEGGPKVCPHPRHFYTSTARVLTRHNVTAYRGCLKNNS
jgi:hypothetical protein